MAGRILRTAFIVAGIMLLSSLAWLSVPVSASIAGGAAIAIGSFALLDLFVRRAVAGAGASRTVFIVAAVAKLSALGAILWAAVAYAPIEPIALMVGLSAIFVSLIVEAIFAPKASEQ